MRGQTCGLLQWTLYQRYGDAGILETQFASMRAWVDLLARIAGTHHLWEGGFQFGDWLDPSVPLIIRERPAPTALWLQQSISRAQLKFWARPRR